MDQFGHLQHYVSLLFFGFTGAFLSFSTLLYFLRSRRWWCSCGVCRAYVSSSWSDEFPNLVDWYTHLLRQSPTHTIHIHVLGNTVTANPDNVEHMLRSRFDNYPKGPAFSAILGDLLGRGIFNVDGEPWRFQRKMASLELGSASVRSHALDIVSSEIRSRLLPLLRSSPPPAVVDLQDVFRRFSFDAICRISFGLDPGCLERSLPAPAFAQAFDAASSLSARRAAAAAPAVWRIKRLLNLGTEAELASAVKMVDRLAAEVIRQKRKLGFAGDHDLLARFMASVDDDRYLRDIVVSFLLAGRDTVASGLTTFFLLLTANPEAAAKVRAEVDRVMADGDVASYEQLNEMSYVHAAMYESMRLYPPVQFDSKHCVDDDVLPDGTFVGSGTRVTYHPYAMGRMEGIWGDDCHVFRPERWIRAEDGGFRVESPYRYPVFQGGQRVCLGKEMAVMEMKAVIVAVVRGFDVHVEGAAARAPRFAPGLTASLAGGLPATVRRRRGL